jgi:agmatinase
MPKFSFLDSDQNFLGLDRSTSGEASPFFILPVPFEKTTSFMQGTKKAPEAILKASHQVETFDEELMIGFEEIGAATLAPFSPSKDQPEVCFPELRKQIENILHAGKFPVCLGGEHSITFPIVQAFRKFYPDIFVIQFDAHGDLRPQYFGSIYSHASVMYRIHEAGIPYAALGLRSISEAEVTFLMTQNIPHRFAHSLQQEPDISSILNQIKGPVYITFDFDVLDPSVLADVGTPVPGGLLWYRVISLIRQIINSRNVVGIDFVEFLPFALSEGPAFTCAQFIFKTLTALAASSRRTESPIQE